MCAAFAVMLAMPAASFAKHLVSNQEATRLGLQRAWFAQVRVDSAQQKVVQWVLDQGQLFALTRGGTIQSLDSETGEILWTAEIGAGKTPAVGIGVNSKYVATLHAGQLHLLDRADGQHLWSRPIGGPTCAAPALGENHAYVALLSGRVEGYPLDNPSAFAWQYQSLGHTYQCPTITGNTMSWPSDRGLLYVAQANSPRVLFRVEANDEIVAAPASQTPYLYVGSLDGYFYCFHETSGSERWRYATGYAITTQPAVVGNKAFVASEAPALHAVDALTGQALWQAEGVEQFVAAGRHHTYGMDRYGALMVLDSGSGALAGRLATGAGSTALVNNQSDRIFLVNDRGLVQCLHEVDAIQPTWHQATQAADSTPESAETTATEDPHSKDYIPNDDVPKAYAPEDYIPEADVPEDVEIETDAPFGSPFAAEDSDDSFGTF